MGPKQKHARIIQMMVWRRSDDKILSEAIIAWCADPYIRPSVLMVF